MDRGTYVAATLGERELQKLDVVSNNLANVNTPGFKRQILVAEMQEFEQTLASQFAKDDPYAKGDHERAPGITNIESRTDFSQGAIKSTGNPFDVALTNPNDFFVVSTPEGLQYTRAGNFTLSEDGAVVTPDGFEVQGDGGALTVNGPKPRFSESGALSVNGVNVGRLQVVRFDDPSTLKHAGGTRFVLGDGAAAPQQIEAKVVPSSLEMSNVSTISSMIELISANRGFETYARTAQTIDQLNTAAVTQIGRAR